MIKYFNLFFITILLFGCFSDSNDIKPKRFYIDSFIEGKDTNGDKVLTTPFGTAMFIVGYDNKDLEEVGLFFNNKIIKYHKYFDHFNYYLDKNDEKINNIKVINDAYKEEEIKINDKVYKILDEGIKQTIQSKGKFNILVGELSHAWSSAVLNETNPSDAEIKEKLNCTPSYSEIEDVLVLSKEKKTVKFNEYKGCNSRVSINLGAIGKGYAIDKIIGNKIFEDKNLLINGGNSTIVALGEHPSRDTWNILVETSKIFSSEVKPAFQIKNKNSFFLSTSGADKEWFIDSQNNIRHHIIDATSGYPSSKYLSVTALSNNAMLADYITTSIYSMSLEEISDFLDEFKKQNIKVAFLLQIEQNNQIKLIANDKMLNHHGEDYGVEVLRFEDEFEN